MNKTTYTAECLEKKEGAGGPKKKGPLFDQGIYKGILQAIVINSVGDREVGVGWGLLHGQTSVRVSTGCTLPVLLLGGCGGGGGGGGRRKVGSLTWTDFCQGFLWAFTAGASFPDLLDERCPCTPLPFISSHYQQGGGGVIFHEQSSVRVCAVCALLVLLLGGGGGRGAGGLDIDSLLSGFSLGVPF